MLILEYLTTLYIAQDWSFQTRLMWRAKTRIDNQINYLRFYRKIYKLFSKWKDNINGAHK